MAIYEFSDYTDWDQLPLSYIHLVFPSNEYRFIAALLARSTFDMEPTTEPNDKGGETITGYIVDIDFFPLSNQLEDFVLFTQNIISETLSAIVLRVAQVWDQVPITYIQFSDSSIDIKDWSFNWNVKSSTDTKINLKIHGVLSADAMSATTPKIFTTST